MATSARTEVDTTELASRLRLSVGRLARLMRQQDAGSMPLTQGAMLATIHREGPITLGELAAHEHIAPPTVTKAVGKLEAAGLVTRTVDPLDRRIARIAISDAGNAQLEHNRTRREAWLARRLTGLSPAELQHLIDASEVLEKLTRSEPPS